MLRRRKRQARRT